MIKGLIFDLDGVIVNTENNHFIAWKEIADSLGVDFTKKHNELLKGISRRDSLLAILELGNIHLSDSQIEHLLFQKNEKYKLSISNINKKNILVGVEELLEDARRRNISLAIGSSSKNASFILEKLELKPFFNAIIDGSMVSKAKPDPEVFLKAAETINLLPSECIVFEDSARGVEAAHAGGFKVFVVGNKRVQYSGDKYINNMKEFNLTAYADTF